MECRGNLFREPTRRDLLRWGMAGTAAGALCRGVPCLGQEVVGTEAMPGLALKGLSRHKAMFWEKLGEGRIKCVLCPRECQVDSEERGTCGVRENQRGEYQTLVYGALCSANVDAIEKKPLFHYQPGTVAFSIAAAGCNMECKFCQNWQISQFRPEQVEGTVVSPERLVAASEARRCPTIAYTYSEPVVSAEFVRDSAAAARAAGVGSVMISNGYIQEKPLRELCRQLTAVKIDLKAFSEKFYEEQCTAKLEPVLATLETLKAVGIWFEIVVLIIPTQNDSPEEIGQMCRWVVERLGPDVPMHFTRFKPTYRLMNLPDTPVATLERCRKMAMDAGVHYVYAGNVPMHPGENTYCHGCKAELIRRVQYRVVADQIKDGKCPKCGAAIPGIWSQAQALAFTPREKTASTRPDGA